MCGSGDNFVDGSGATVLRCELARLKCSFDENVVALAENDLRGFTGAAGEDLSNLLDLSGTTHTNVGDYTADAWSFAGNANYNSASGTTISISSSSIEMSAMPIDMPGMSGLDLARAIHHKNPGFPVIVMTAFGPVECEHVKLWLPKEYLFPNLLEKIRFCLSESELEKVEK